MKKSKIGKVVSDKMDKTIVVEVSRLKRHNKYKKDYFISKKFKAHDADNKAKINDLVEIEETKPISKDKTWKLKKIISVQEKQ